MTMLILGHVTVHPQHLDEALRLGCEHSARSRAEPGCIAHDCHQDAENETRIVFVEEWEDMAAIEAHFAVPESGAFVRKIRAISQSDPVMRILQVTPAR